MRKRMSSWKGSQLTQSLILQYVSKVGRLSSLPPQPPKRILSEPFSYNLHSPEDNPFHNYESDHDKVRCKIVEKLLEKKFQRIKTLPEEAPNTGKTIRAKRFEKMIHLCQKQQSTQNNLNSADGRLQRDRFQKRKIKQSQMHIKLPTIKKDKEESEMKLQQQTFGSKLLPKKILGLQKILEDYRSTSQGRDQSAEKTKAYEKRQKSCKKSRQLKSVKVNQISAWTIKEWS